MLLQGVMENKRQVKRLKGIIELPDQDFEGQSHH